MQEDIFSTKILKEDFHKYKLLVPLLHIHDTPLGLYFKASGEEILNSFLNKEFTLASSTGSDTSADKPENSGSKKEFKVLTIVGSRKNSNYGKDALEFLVRSLAEYPVIIVSGLALGIDTLAHTNAMKNKLPTISVPGSGLGRAKLYPAANVNLSDEILKNNGLMMSEWSDDTKSELYFFPKRNRVMAAISDAVLIVEAGEKSGTLITARLAMEYGKNVGVLPNNIFAEASLGSNELIKNGATPVTKVEDILEMLNLARFGEQESLFSFGSAPMKRGAAGNPAEGFVEKIKNLNISDNEKMILELILRDGNLEKDTLLSKLEEENDLSYTDSLVALMQLEINGFIKEEMGEIRIKR